MVTFRPHGSADILQGSSPTPVLQPNNEYAEGLVIVYAYCAT